MQQRTTPRTRVHSMNNSAVSPRNRREQPKPNRPAPASNQRTAGSQVRNTRPKETTASKPVASQSPPAPKTAVNRQGQAVASLLFGSLGILTFLYILSNLSTALKFNTLFSSEQKQVMITSFILNLIGFILGISGKRSSRGSGIAVVGMTLSSIPLGICLVILIVWVMMKLSIQI